MSESPVIYVDLIEAKPISQKAYTARHSENPAAYSRYINRFQPWRIVVISGGNHRALFRSTERYFNRADAIHAAELAFGERSNVYLRVVGQGNQILRMAVPL